MKVRLQGYAARDINLIESPVELHDPRRVKVCLLITDDHHYIKHWVDVTKLHAADPNALELVAKIVCDAIVDAETSGRDSARAAMREALGIEEPT